MSLYIGNKKVTPIKVSGGKEELIPKEINSEGMYRIKGTITEFKMPNTILDLGDNVLCGAFYGNYDLKVADLSSLTKISGYNAMASTFKNCWNLTTVDLSNVTEIGMDSLTEAFESCSSLTSINFDKLTTAGRTSFYRTFSYCTNLQTIDFPSLTNLQDHKDGAFINSFEYTNLTDIYFRALTSNSFNGSPEEFVYMLRNATSTRTIKVHFPSNIENTISTLDGYPLFGGRSGKVELLFDLPATE